MDNELIKVREVFAKTNTENIGLIDPFHLPKKHSNPESGETDYEKLMKLVNQYENDKQRAQNKKSETNAKRKSPNK
jgi:hypothetical protein